MRKRLNSKKVVGFVLVLLLLLTMAAGLVYYFLLPEVPSREISAAREKLASARDADADRYDPVHFRDAAAMYDSAMAAWQRENQKFILFRDYARVKEFALKSVELSLGSSERAAKNARNALHQTGSLYETLRGRVKRISALYGSLPMSDKFRDNFNKAKLLLEEARIARNKHDFHKAESLLQKADGFLQEASQAGEIRMQSYFKDFRSWESLYKKSVAASASGHTALVVVDKLAGELRLYKDGKLRHTYNAEFGPNWLGDKNHQGDQATPEGSYLVVKKKERRQTRYYKALLLNYPNSDDMQRYRNNVRNGAIPKNVDVGGLIEIHGHGGQGFNWTNGCVAVTDKEMDVVYRMASVNTPVIIIGSLIPYEEWVERQLKDLN